MPLNSETATTLEFVYILTTPFAALTVLVCSMCLLQHKFSRSTRRRAAIIGVCVLVVWIPLSAFVRVATGFGILFFRGSDHYVIRALNETEDRVALQELENVANSSIDGPHALHEAIKRIPASGDRIRLFRMAKVVAPGWETTWDQELQRMNAAP